MSSTPTSTMDEEIANTLDPTQFEGLPAIPADQPRVTPHYHSLGAFMATSNLDTIRERDKPNTDDNIPPRFELFILGPGEKKVTVTPDTRIPSSATFVFNKEDHTLGNLIRAQLLRSEHVRFAAYKVPHPLIASFELRVQTDGEITPTEAVLQACSECVNDLGKLSRRFTEEWELFKAAKGGNAGQ